MKNGLKPVSNQYRCSDSSLCSILYSTRSSRSADTVRDIRGFATKFYTDEGNFDLVANDAPVFFIQDGIKFPDFVHALKPEPQTEIPSGASAHDTFWDFVSLVPESAHAVMWAMSDRAFHVIYARFKVLAYILPLDQC